MRDKSTQDICTRASRMCRDTTDCLIISLEAENHEKQKIIQNTTHDTIHNVAQPVSFYKTFGIVGKGKRSRFDGAARKTDQSLAHRKKRGCLTFFAPSRTPPHDSHVLPVGLSALPQQMHQKNA